MEPKCSGQKALHGRIDVNAPIQVIYLHRFMRKLATPLFLIYKLWIGLVFWVTLALLYPFFRVVLSSRRLYPAAFRLKRFWSRLLGLLLVCPVRREVRGQLPPAPYIVVSNHCSHLDTVFMYRVIEDYFVFMGKGELLRWPLFRRFFRTTDIAVHRENRRKSYEAMNLAGDALKRGECVAIYPEGTIPRDSPRMKPFKNGAFRLAAELGVPVVPVTWVSNYKVLRDPENLFEPSRPAIVHVVIHPPEYALGNSDADVVHLRNRVFGVVQSALPETFRSQYDH